MMEENILKLIEKKYQSFENPTYFFVDEALKEKNYSLLIEKLKNYFKTEEYMFLKWDVCFSYKIYGKENHWWVMLSMVGPFGVVIRFKNGEKLGENLAKVEEGLTLEEKKLLTEINNFGIRLLTSGELIERVPLNINIEEGDDLNYVKIYNAIFSVSPFFRPK